LLEYNRQVVKADPQKIYLRGDFRHTPDSQLSFQIVNPQEMCFYSALSQRSYRKRKLESRFNG
jgi:hypothetical protein